MNIQFEGHLPAQQEAANHSSKNKSEAWVVKANYGGLKYFATDSIENLPAGAKVIDHYKNGLKQ